MTPSFATVATSVAAVHVSFMMAILVQQGTATATATRAVMKPVMIARRPTRMALHVPMVTPVRWMTHAQLEPVCPGRLGPDVLMGKAVRTMCVWEPGRTPLVIFR